MYNKYITIYLSFVAKTLKLLSVISLEFLFTHLKDIL